MVVNMITISQIRAARGLINWSQKQLGEKAKLSQTAIANIENSKVQPTKQSLSAIKEAFEREAIEFIDGGIRHRPDGIEIIEGDDFAWRIMDMIYETLLNTGAEEVLLNGYEPGYLNKEQSQKVENHVRRLLDAGKKQRILVKEGVQAQELIRSAPAPLEWYRCIPETSLSSLSPFFIFHNNYAIELFEKKRVIIIKNADLADYQRQQFNLVWDNAQPVGT